MKNLRSYLNESVWDIEDNVENDNEETIQADIVEFINQTYMGDYNDVINSKYLKFHTKNDKFIVDYVGDDDIIFNPISFAKADKLTNGLFEWGKISKSFICHLYNAPIKTLEGAPKWGGEYFTCCDSKYLESLEGGPEYAGHFICDRCPIKTLEGGPKKVNGEFNCDRCPELKSLKGGPEYVGGSFSCCCCKKLESLEGAPKTVDGDFDCSGNPILKSLKGASKTVKGNFICSDCPITSLEGAPEEVGVSFMCHDCTKLESLKGAPKKVSYNFDCRRCPNLHSLDGVGKVKGKIFSTLKT